MATDVTTSIVRASAAVATAAVARVLNRCYYSALENGVTVLEASRNTCFVAVENRIGHHPELMQAGLRELLN
jgi:hypothetical protein